MMDGQTEPKWQCGSCEGIFNAVSPTECPLCGSGNYVEGHIDSDYKWMVPYGDIRDSFKLAMQGEKIDKGTIERILDTVNDAVSNNLGD